MRDWSKASREDLECLACLCDSNDTELRKGSVLHQHIRRMCESAPQLRSQRLVDADIAQGVRMALAEGASLGAGTGDLDHRWASLLQALAAEKFES